MAVERALLSVVFDKTGIVEFARRLGGAEKSKFSRPAAPRNSFAKQVSPVKRTSPTSRTGRKCSAGRVKTLHPKVARRPALPAP